MTNLLNDTTALVLGTIFASSLIIHILTRLRIFAFPDTNKHKKTSDNVEKPLISVIVTTNNQARYLEQNINDIIQQDYPNFEIIIVDEASTDDTPDAIKRIKNLHKSIKHTFIPFSAKYISKSKLGITLGVKAAKGEWIVLTKSDCRPASKQWLSAMAKAFGPNVDMVLGYSNYQNNHSIKNNRRRLKRMIQQLRFFRAAKDGRAVGGDETNLAIRRSHFEDSKGFSTMLDLLGGEDILFVDNTARKNNTAIVTDPRAKMIQLNPNTNQRWHQKQMMQAGITNFLSFHGHFECFKWNMAHLVFITTIISGILLGKIFWNNQFDLGILVIIISFLMEIVIGFLLLSNSSKKFDENNCIYLYPFFALTQPIYDLIYKILSQINRRKLMRGF